MNVTSSNTVRSINMRAIYFVVFFSLSNRLFLRWLVLVCSSTPFRFLLFRFLFWRRKGICIDATRKLIRLLFIYQLNPFTCFQILSNRFTATPDDIVISCAPIKRPQWEDSQKWISRRSGIAAVSLKSFDSFRHWLNICVSTHLIPHT